MANGCGMMKGERDTKEMTYSARNTDPAISGLACDRYGGWCVIAREADGGSCTSLDECTDVWNEVMCPRDGDEEENLRIFRSKVLQGCQTRTVNEGSQSVSSVRPRSHSGGSGERGYYSGT